MRTCTHNVVHAPVSCHPRRDKHRKWLPVLGWPAREMINSDLKGPLKVISSKLPSQAAPPKALHSGLYPGSFWISPKWGKLHSLSRQTFPMLGPTVKKFLLMFRWNLMCISLCPLPRVLLLGTTRKSPAPSSDTLVSNTDRHWWVPSQFSPG